MRLLRLALPVAMIASVAAAPPPPAPIRLSYAAYLAGIQVAELQASLGFTPQSYRMDISFHLVGVAAELFHAQGDSRADGRFQGGVALPRELFSAGLSGGKTHVTQIDYQDGRPVLMQLQPPLEKQREPVPPDQQVNTIDSLSAVALMLHQVWTAGRCEGDARVYDGRWLSELTTATAGEQALDPTSRSPFSGPALGCDIEARQLAGFERGDDAPSLHKPHHATVWFARAAPGGPLLPIRIRIETGGFGAAMLYLTAVS